MTLQFVALGSSAFYKLITKHFPRECAQSKLHMGMCNHVWLGEVFCLASALLLPTDGVYGLPVAPVPAAPSSFTPLDYWPGLRSFWVGSSEFSVIFCVLPASRKVSWRCPFYFQHIWEGGYIYGLGWLLTMLFTRLEAYRPSSCHRLYQIT